MRQITQPSHKSSFPKITQKIHRKIPQKKHIGKNITLSSIVASAPEGHPSERETDLGQEDLESKGE